MSLPNRTNSTNYEHPQETNLLNLHRAMSYNSQGEPVLRTTSGSSATTGDAFGRVRIAAPFTLFDSFHRYQDNAKAEVFTAGGGTSTYDTNSSSILMTVGTAKDAEVIRETSRVFAYQPGKSLQMMITFTMSPAKTNLRQRAGLFDAQNGVYVQLKDNVLSFVLRSYSTGVLVETVVPQSQWNVERLDGAGTNPTVLDITKSQIFWLDIEWLGVGTVRCGFVINGEFIHCHSFHHANLQTSTYMTTACLPGRVEIKNVDTTASASTYRQICFTVISEGGYELRGRPRSVGHALTAPYRMSSPGVTYPLLSIRLKSDRLGAIVVPKNFTIAVTSSGSFRYGLISRGVTSGGLWVSAGTDSHVEYNLTATSLSSGTVFETGYIISSNQSSAAPSLQEYPFKFQLERNTFTPVAYEFIIAMVCTGNNQDVFASVNWEEIT
jgi:hypothetical protein